MKRIKAGIRDVIVIRLPFSYMLKLSKFVYVTYMEEEDRLKEFESLNNKIRRQVNIDKPILKETPNYHKSIKDR